MNFCHPVLLKAVSQGTEQTNPHGFELEQLTLTQTVSSSF